MKMGCGSHSDKTEIVCEEADTDCDENILLLQSTKTMSKHIPEFYESILEASRRGELWRISSEQTIRFNCK